MIVECDCLINVICVRISCKVTQVCWFPLTTGCHLFHLLFIMACSDYLIGMLIQTLVHIRASLLMKSKSVLSVVHCICKHRLKLQSRIITVRIAPFNSIQQLLSSQIEIDTDGYNTCYKYIFNPTDSYGLIVNPAGYV